MDAKLQKSVQEQFSQELANAHTYLRFSLVMENLAWDGFAKFFAHNEQEERQHARGFAGLLIDFGIEPAVPSLPAAAGAGDVVACFRSALALEQTNTERIRDLYRLAEETKECLVGEFLLPYLKEQRESVRQFSDIKLWLERAQGNDAAMRDLDAKLGSL